MANAYFDAAYYLATYPDLATSGVTAATAWAHYEQYGAAEGRKANAWFDTGYYLANNADVAASVQPAQALAHYVEFGAAEGRSPIEGFVPSLFDASFYASANADVAAAAGVTNPAALTADQVLALTSHYLAYGAAEGRQANAWFDAKFYVSAYADLAGLAPAAALAHYAQFGAAEGRKPIAWFDAANYASTNADVAAALGITNPAALTLDNVQALFAHFYNFGAAEFRAPQAGISYDLAAVQAYVTANADIAAAYGISNPAQITPEQVLAVVRQFFEFGSKEGRPAALAVIDQTSGGTFVLTTAQQTLTGTAGDDVFKGVSSALSAERTLRADDQLDGGAGRDTLQVDVKNDFGGFTGTGKAENFEVIDLTNGTNLDRSFNATGVKGADTYNINSTNGKAINLAGVEKAGITVNLNGVKENTTVGFAANATKDSKALTLGLNNVGTAADAKATPAVAEKAVAVTAAGIEALTVNATGANVVDLANAATKTITIAGEGSAKVTAVNAGVTAVDASGLKGAADLNLGAVNGGTLTSVKGGAGDDTIAVSTAGLKANAVIDGGEGKDSLNLTVAGDVTVQYELANIESLTFSGSANKALTFSGTNAGNLDTVSLAAQSNNDITLVNFASSNLTANIATTNAGATAGSLTSVNTGSATVNVSGNGTSSTNVTASSASELTLNVGKGSTYTGTVVSGATSVAAAIAGTVTGAAITAAKAESITISEVASDSSLTVTAGVATTATVKAAKNLDLSASTLTKLQTLAVETAGNFKAGNLTAINTATISGTGKAELGNLGAANQEYAVNVTASGVTELKVGTVTTQNAAYTLEAAAVKGTVDQGAINVGTGTVTLNLNGTEGATQLGTITANTVSIDAKGALGQVNYGAVTANTVTLNGAELSATTLNVTAKSGENLAVTVNGGIAQDVVTVTGIAATKQATVSGDLGIGNDQVTVDLGTSTAAVTINVAELKGVGLTTSLKVGAVGGSVTLSAGNDVVDATLAVVAGGNNNVTTITGFSTGDVVKLAATGALAAATDLSGAATEAAALNLLAAGAADSITWGQYGGATYAVYNEAAGAGLANDDVVVKLTGALDLVAGNAGEVALA